MSDLLNGGYLVAFGGGSCKDFFNNLKRVKDPDLF